MEKSNFLGSGTFTEVFYKGEDKVRVLTTCEAKIALAKSVTQNEVEGLKYIGEGYDGVVELESGFFYVGSPTCEDDIILLDGLSSVENSMNTISMNYESTMIDRLDEFLSFKHQERVLGLYNSIKENYYGSGLRLDIVDSCDNCLFTRDNKMVLNDIFYSITSRDFNRE